MIGSRAGRALTAPVIAFACVLLGFTTAPVADAAVCATHFIGLHGVGEGTESATIVETIKATRAANEYKQSAGGVRGVGLSDA
jgi:hypothetical protein